MDWRSVVDDELAGESLAIPGNAYGGLVRERALQACKSFAGRDIGVLGGDVWAWNGSRFRPMGELGWATDRRSDETWAEFRQRSIAKTEQEIGRELTLGDGEQAVYVLVCTTELESIKYMHGGRGA